MNKREERIEGLKLNHSLAIYRADRITAIILTLLRAGGWCLFVWIVAGAVENLAGKETDASFSAIVDVKFIANRYFRETVFAGIGFFGTLYGYSQRRLYKKVVEKLKRMEKLEEIIDPNRSSSGLQDGFQGNPNDRIYR
jgi:hypothetical protein